MSYPGFSKSGNLQRAEWRSKIRHVLADHLSKSNAPFCDKTDEDQHGRNLTEDLNRASKRPFNAGN